MYTWKYLYFVALGWCALKYHLNPSDLLLFWILYHFVVPFFVSFIGFILESVFSDISIGTSAFLLYFHFHEILFSIYSLTVCVCIFIWCVSCRQRIHGIVFLFFQLLYVFLFLYFKLNLGETLVNHDIYTFQIYWNLWPVYCNVCPPPKVKSLSITIYLTSCTLY